MQLNNALRKSLRRISLTPLIDLVFILLVFFILQTSFIQFRALGVTVPTDNPQGESAGQVLAIDVFADGKLWLQGETLRVKELDSYLRLLGVDAQTTVLVRAGDDVTLQILVKVLDQLHGSGLQRIQILGMEAGAL